MTSRLISLVRRGNPSKQSLIISTKCEKKTDKKVHEWSVALTIDYKQTEAVHVWIKRAELNVNK